jgi:hypothetical protein
MAIWFAILRPIVQDPGYHAFADARTLLGVPNFWNVISNIPFFIVALYGIRALRSRTAFIETWERIAYCDLHPDNARLFWDRLPMTVVFMSLVATTIGERIGMRAGKSLLLPLILTGLGSVLYWRFTGDLRLYALIQFGSMLALPILLLLFPPRYSRAGAVWCTVILYAIAKTAELLDRQIASVIATGGHPWKHVAAAAAIFVYISAVARRRPL